MVGSSLVVEEVAVNHSQLLEGGVEGSLVGLLEHHQWEGVAVEEEGCPLQVELEESWLAGGGWVSQNSWQPKEVVEEEGLGLEVVVAEPRPNVEVGQHF